MIVGEIKISDKLLAIINNFVEIITLVAGCKLVLPKIIQLQVDPAPLQWIDLYYNCSKYIALFCNAK